MAIFGVKYPNRKSPPPMPEVLRKKIGERMKGNKYNLGRKQSKETIAKRFLWQKGYRHSSATREKIRLANKKWVHPKGENHPNWKGGTSSGYSYPDNWTEDLKESIRKRDNYICQICEKTELENKEKLTVHHIDYNKDNLNPDNLITLCRSCHMKTNYNREYWTNYFNKQNGRI